MAATKEKTADQLFEEMKDYAIEQQQCYYELLPDWTEYKFINDPKKSQLKYLKQNIGYALFGPPTRNEEDEIDETENSRQPCYALTENSNNTEADTADAVDYDSKAKLSIDHIYNQIRECINMEADPLQSIDFGVIYSIIVYDNANVESKTKEEEKKTAQEETKANNSKKKEETKATEKKVSVVPVPVFKIRKSIKKTVDNAEMPSTSTNNADDIIWYIDTNGRVYSSWSDYTGTNHLPECIMVLPKDGFYQPNPIYPIEEDYSTVWIESMESPACALASKVYNHIDNVSNIVGIGMLGLTAAALFTPLAPVAIISSAPAVGAATVSGIWTAFRNSQELIDRHNHKESINPLDKEAFPCWLGLTGSMTCLGATGGEAIISKFAANGRTIPTMAKVAFNTVKGGNLVLNGIGVAYMSYNMMEKYWAGEITYLDALNLATHIMFFTSSVMNVKFANDIIQDSQGKVIEEYKKTRRSKNLRRKFNRAARKAAENNTSKISENAEVIRFIRNRQDFLSFDQSINGQLFDKTSHNPVWSFDQDKVRIGNIILLDPIEYAMRLISAGIFFEPKQTRNPSDSQDNSNNSSISNELKELLYDLLTELCLGADCPGDIPTLSDFEQLLEDLSSLNINSECLRMLFKIAVTLMRYNKEEKNCLLICFNFIWRYCKTNLKRWGIKTLHRMQSESGSYILQKIIIVVSEAVDMFDNLVTAVTMYMEAYSFRYCSRL